MLALILFAIGSRLIAMIRHFFRRAMERSSASEEAAQFLDSSIKFVSYTILVFMILQLFGVEAASIATVIGSVGVTIGLAIQGSLSNCIGGILIMMLKPFHVGDYIIEGGGNEGIVQQISVFYTKLATYDNQIILIPNGNLANSSLTNVTDEAERRVDLKVGISYDSDIRSARKAVQEIAKKNPYVLPEREITVNVDELADSSVVLVVKFWAKKETTGRRAIRCWRISSTASMKRASAFRIRRWMYIWSPGLDLQENPCIIIPYLHRAEKVGVRALSPAAFFPLYAPA